MSFPTTDLSHLLGTDVSPVSDAVAPSTAMAAAGGGVAFDGSSTVDQLATWAPALRSADGDMLFEKPRLDARSRDMLRNDAFVAGGATVHKDNIVGEQYRLNARPNSKILFGAEDETWETEAQEEIETRFALWAESPMCWPDAQRVNTLTDLVRMAVGTHVAGGEVLATAEWDDDGRPFASNMLMIDADRLSTPADINTLMNPRIRAGVERTKRGAPIAYHIRNDHPSDFFLNYQPMGQATWKRVKRFNSWGRQQVLHIYESLRPDQTRGLASMVTALGEMRMLKHFRKSELQRAVVAASYAASIETDLPSDAAMAMGAGQSSENPYTSALQEFMAMQAEYQGSARNIHMEGAKIPVFMPNTHLKIQNPGAESPLGDSFEASMLRHIAASLRVSYEELSGDYTKTNYSSARASIGASLRGMRPKKRLVADGTANFGYRLWMEEAINYADLECFKRRNMPSFYERQNADAYCTATWIGAGQGQIDPLKETQAAILRIKNGLSTQEVEIAKMSGSDWRQIKRQNKRERGMDKTLGNPSIYDVTDNQDQQNALTGTEREASNGE